MGECVDLLFGLPWTETNRCCQIERRRLLPANPRERTKNIQLYPHCKPRPDLVNPTFPPTGAELPISAKFRPIM